MRWGPGIVLMPAVACLCAPGFAEEAPRPVTGTVTVEECQIQVVRQALIATERDGVVESIAVQVGETVEQGVELLRLRAEVSEAAFALSDLQARSDVELRLARSLAESLRSDYEAVLELDREGAVSSQELRHRKREYDRAVLTVEQREYEQQVAQLSAETALAELNAYSVRAPFPATVTRILKSPGESVQDGEPVLELVNTDIVQVEGYGTLGDFWNVEPGAPVQVQLDVPELAESDFSDEIEEWFEGTLILVDPVVQPVTRRVRIVAEVPNRDNILRDGLRARMTVDLTFDRK